MKDLTIGIIGCGNMGSAITRGITDNNTFVNSNISLYDKIAGKAVHLAEETGCVHGELAQIVTSADILLIAVKPQDSDELFREIVLFCSGPATEGSPEDEVRGEAPPTAPRNDVGAASGREQTIVSIMAGVTINSIVSKLGKETPVVRAMPNMAAFVGESITCISYNDTVTDQTSVKNIFTGIGKVLEVDENFMDSVTALSGSGPAYLFYLAEAMLDAAGEFGFKEDAARELVVQTLYGASALLRKGASSPKELIGKVASKGGTTEAALSIFDEKDLKFIIKSAIQKAKQRSKELSRG